MTVTGVRTATIVIRGPLRPEDLPGLFARTCRTLERSRPELLLCEVMGVAADAVAVDALARLALGARREGCGVELRGANSELRELVRFVGLADVLRAAPEV